MKKLVKRVAKWLYWNIFGDDEVVFYVFENRGNNIINKTIYKLYWFAWENK